MSATPSLNDSIPRAVLDEIKSADGLVDRNVNINTGGVDCDGESDNFSTVVKSRRRKPDVTVGTGAVGNGFRGVFKRV